MHRLTQFRISEMELMKILPPEIGKHIFYLRDPIEALRKTNRLYDTNLRFLVENTLSFSGADVLKACFTPNQTTLYACINDDIEKLREDNRYHDKFCVILALVMDSEKILKFMFRYLPRSFFENNLEDFVYASILSGNPANLSSVLNKTQHTLDFGLVIFRLAILSRRVEMVDAVLALDPEFNRKILCNKTTFVMAAMTGEVKIVERMLALARENNVDLFESDKELDLEIAAISGKPAMVNLFFDLAKRYDFTLKVSENTFKAAINSGNPGMLKLIASLERDPKLNLQRAINTLYLNAKETGKAEMIDALAKLAKEERVPFDEDKLDSATMKSRP